MDTTQSQSDSGLPSHQLLGIALLVVRIMIGAIFIGHGAQKLFGFWHGPGMAGFTGMVAHMGFPLPGVFAYLAAISEFGGGLALIIGLLARLGALGIAFSMLVAIFRVHLPNGLLGAGHDKPGFDFPLACLAGAAVIILLGAGHYSVDAILAEVRRGRK
ncbi:MAG: DoxX family protein [Armatimonadota bacterium]|nr:DoxX family protein [Armatimonadota bacterium]